MSSVTEMLKPLRIGKHTMANRFVMAPLTRARAEADHVAGEDMVKYYSDRAGFGLIISEATQIQKGYSCFAHEGGIYGEAQVDGWRKVTDAVHAKGGLIYCQLHHAGRAAPPSNVDAPLKVVAPSSVGIINHASPSLFNRSGEKEAYDPAPHAITLEEIPSYIDLYVTAAKNAMAAGFDGVEVHSANGYLLDQFMRSASNQRTDEYGGSIENRARMLLEVVDAVIAAVGSDCVSVRLSPKNLYNDMSDEDPKALTQYICKELNKRKLAFLDMMRGGIGGNIRGADEWAREVYEGVMFSGCGFELAEAEEYIKDKKADAIVFGVKAIANPDLVKRAIAGAELNPPRPELFYTRGNEGYNDYPTLA